MSVENTIRLLYMIHHRGRSRAITRDKFRKQYACLLDGMSDREFRDVYAKLPICTSSSDGGYWPASGDEVHAFKEETEKRQHALQQRKVMVLKAHRNLIRDPKMEALAKQQELPL